MVHRVPITTKPELTRTCRCKCNRWGNWRNMFVLLLVLCSVIFIVTDLYHLTHLELLAFRLHAPSQTNQTGMQQSAPPNHHYGHYQREVFRSSKIRSTDYQTHMFHKQLLSPRHMSDEMLLCAKRWQTGWPIEESELNGPNKKSTFSNWPHITAGHVKGQNIFREKSGQIQSLRQTKIVRQKRDNLTFELQFSPGITVHLEISDIRLLPEYHDVAHTHSDNGIVLDTSRRSNMHHWRAPLQTLLQSKCRHPLPKHYYLTMHPYVDRHTVAKRRTCARTGATLMDTTELKKPFCPPGLPSGSVYYERSINGQCTQNLISATLITDKASFLPPQRNSIYCTTNSALVTDLFDEHITERQSYLKDAHCDTQRRLCQTCLRRSCWATMQRRPAGSELIGDLTQSWDWMRDETAGRKTDEIKHNCCGVNCYSNPSCQEYYNPSCQRYTISQPEMDEVCLQGQTLKFTLNPEFDLNNGSYLCHVRHNSPDQVYFVRSWLVVDNQWQTEPLQFRLTTSDKVSDLASSAARDIVLIQGGHVQRRSRANIQQMVARQKHGLVRLWANAVQIEHRSNLPHWTEAIVKQDATSSDRLSLYRLKSFDEFQLSKPELQKHRDEKYVVVQFTRPFLHNTESWGNQSCNLNISHFHSGQPIYSANDGVAIGLANPITQTSTGAFEYVVDDLKSPSAQIQVSTNPESTRSILHTAFCFHGTPLRPVKSEYGGSSSTHRNVGVLLNRLGRQIRASTEQVHMTFNPLTCTEEQIWRVTVNGWINNKPTYLRLEIYQNSITLSATDQQIPVHQILLRNEDLLILPSSNAGQELNVNPIEQNASAFPFSFSLDLRITTVPNQFVVQPTVPVIHIRLSDCSRQYTIHATLKASRTAESQNLTWSRRALSVQTTTKQLLWNTRMMNRIHLPFVVTCTTIGLLYLILLIIYGIVRACSSSAASRNRLNPPTDAGKATNPNTKSNYDNSIRLAGGKNGQRARRPHSTSMCSVNSLLSTPIHDPYRSPHRMSSARKLMVMAYLCFRVFYTFLFTISVAVSFVLSIESNAAREFNSAIYGRFGNRQSSSFAMHSYGVSSLDLENRWRGAKSWMFEAARMEDFSQSELLRQFQSLNTQVSKCAEVNRLISVQLAQSIQQSSAQYKDWLDPRRDTIALLDRPSLTVVNGKYKFLAGANQTWSTTPTDLHFTTIDRSTWNLMENANWLPYLDTVDEYLRKVRDNLDSRVIDRWAPFDRILANLLSNTWIAPARRALNSSWLRVKHVSPSGGGREAASNVPLDDNYYYYYEDGADQSSPSANTNGGQTKESRTLKLANFLGVPQPTHARLTGARIWNSFRSVVPGLPSRFYYDLSSQLLNDPGRSNERVTRFIDQRYMLSNEDWKHVAGGYLGENPSKAYRYLQNLDVQGLPRSEVIPDAVNPLPSSSYFLNLTQIRLILLLLDAIIILARCYQTFRFMQNVWFGTVERVPMERIVCNAGQVTSTVGELASGVSVRSVYLDSTDFMHPPTCSSYPGRSDGTSVSAISDAAPMSPQPITSPIRQNVTNGNPEPFDMMLCEQLKPSSTRLYLRPTEFRSHMDGPGSGRLTACYCCLDAHYLLIIIGIGLLMVGLVLLWVADRHVRPGWLLAKTGVFARSRALEECRLRTNAILKSIQPTHLNRNIMRVMRNAMQSETRRLDQMRMRFQHEKVQIARQYFSELCTLEKSSLASSAHAPGQNTADNVWKVTSTSACALFNANMEFTRLVTQTLLPAKPDSHNLQTVVPGGQSAVPVEPLVCLLTPIVPATYTEGHASRMLRLAQTMSKLKPPADQNQSGRTYVSMRWAQNRPGQEILVTDDQLFLDLDQLSLSMGSLAALLNALHRLLLTSLTVILAMGGLLACLHLAKLVAQRTCPVRSGKIRWITSFPPQTLTTSDTVRT